MGNMLVLWKISIGHINWITGSTASHSYFILPRSVHGSLHLDI